MKKFGIEDSELNIALNKLFNDIITDFDNFCLECFK